MMIILRTIFVLAVWVLWGILALSCQNENKNFCAPDTSFETTAHYIGWCTEEFDGELNTKEYDEVGNLIEEYASFTEMTLYYYYYPDGNLEHKEQWFTPESDMYVETQMSATDYYYEFDSDGGYMTEKKEELDRDLDGVPDYRKVTYYDENGKIVLIETDEGADDLEVSTQTNHYEDGNLVLSETDMDGDGTVDQSVNIYYNFDIGEVVVESDFDGDGTVDERSVSTSDENGTVVEIDQEADGTIDIKRIYTRDENGNIISVETDDGNDGNINYGVFSQYDTFSNILTQHVEEEGVSDACKKYTYDCWQ